jgi:hypothetical protein
VSRHIPLHFRRRDGEEYEGGGGSGSGSGGSRQQGSRGRDGNRRRGGPLEGGMGGRAEGGEWQVELPDASRDPRDLLREQEGGGDSNSAAIAAATAAVLHEFNAENYPTLASANDSGGGGGGSTPLWVGGRGGGRGGSRAEDFPSLGHSSRQGTQQGWGNLGIRVDKKLSVRPRAGNAHNSGANKVAAAPGLTVPTTNKKPQAAAAAPAAKVAAQVAS